MILERGRAASPKQLRSPPFQMLRNELPELVDDCDRVQVAIALRFSPSEEPVTAKKDAIAPEPFRIHAASWPAQNQAAGQKPACEVRSVELFHFLAAIGRSGEGDSPVRVQMIDMFKRQKRV